MRNSVHKYTKIGKLLALTEVSPCLCVALSSTEILLFATLPLFFFICAEAELVLNRDLGPVQTD